MGGGGDTLFEFTNYIGTNIRFHILLSGKFNQYYIKIMFIVKIR